MTEYDMIRTIAARFPRSASQLNAPFECDAELLTIGTQVWGLTLDDFSPEEDRFTSEDPEALGANLAVCTLSDLLAAGVEPRFFMHALSLPSKVTPAFVEGLTKGLSTVLAKAGCALCGGDLGTADTWRYSGFAMGPVRAAAPLTHRLKGSPGTLWVTGRLGDANRAVLERTPTPAFELRLAEAEVIRKWASGCIDTSGGLMDALWILHELNPDLRIDLHAERIPLAAGLREFARRAGVPAEAALVGGAGEYELLFATSRDLPDGAGSEIEQLGITAIADISLGGAPGVFVDRHGARIGSMTEPPPCPRTQTLSDHVQAVASFAAALFGGRASQ
jgi:thiamine-monophosphate kinase